MPMMTCTETRPDASVIATSDCGAMTGFPPGNCTEGPYNVPFNINGSNSTPASAAGRLSGPTSCTTTNCGSVALIESD